MMRLPYSVQRAVSGNLSAVLSAPVVQKFGNGCQFTDSNPAMRMAACPDEMKIQISSTVPASVCSVWLETIRLMPGTGGRC